MIITSIILYFIVAYSISFMFVQSMGPFHIFDKLRNWLGDKSETLKELFDCMYCFPSWVGLGLSAINQFILPQIPFTPSYISPERPSPPPFPSAEQSYPRLSAYPEIPAVPSQQFPLKRGHLKNQTVPESVPSPLHR